MEDKVAKHHPMEIKKHSQWIVEYQQDIEQVKAHTPPDRDTFPPMQINDVTYGEKKEAGQAIIAAFKAMTSPDSVPWACDGAYLQHLQEGICHHPTYNHLNNRTPYLNFLNIFQ